MALAQTIAGVPKPTNGKVPAKKYLVQVTPAQRDAIVEEMGLNNSLSDVMLGQKVVECALYFCSIPEGLQEQAAKDYEGTIPIIAKR